MVWDDYFFVFGFYRPWLNLKYAYSIMLVFLLHIHIFRYFLFHDYHDERGLPRMLMLQSHFTTNPVKERFYGV